MISSGDSGSGYAEDNQCQGPAGAGQKGVGIAGTVLKTMAVEEVGQCCFEAGEMKAEVRSFPPPVAQRRPYSIALSIKTPCNYHNPGSSAAEVRTTRRAGPSFPTQRSRMPRPRSRRRAASRRGAARASSSRTRCSTTSPSARTRSPVSSRRAVSLPLSYSPVQFPHANDSVRGN